MESTLQYQNQTSWGYETKHDAGEIRPREVAPLNNRPANQNASATTSLVNGNQLLPLSWPSAPQLGGMVSFQQNTSPNPEFQHQQQYDPLPLEIPLLQSELQYQYPAETPVSGYQQQVFQFSHMLSDTLNHYVPSLAEFYLDAQFPSLPVIHSLAPPSFHSPEQQQPSQVTTNKHKVLPNRRKLCCEEGCKSQARAYGRCKRHGGSRRCSSPGCTKGVQSRGLCILHGGGLRCQEVGCDRASQSHGKCKLHGGGRKCTAVGCEKSAHLKRLCRKHGGGIKCCIAGCEKWALRRTMCAKHTNEIQSVGEVSAVPGI